MEAAWEKEKQELARVRDELKQQCAEEMEAISGLMKMLLLLSTMMVHQRAPVFLVQLREN